MDRDNLNNAYFEWMYAMMNDWEPSIYSYRKLFTRLYQTPFSWTMIRDHNRNEDGLDLRYIFACENGIAPSAVYQAIPGDICSVLEMMIALSRRIEDTIMLDYNDRDRTSDWFWEMLDSLGLSCMDDEHYVQQDVDYILMRCLTRTYEPNGMGGFFRITDPSIDMRYKDIWYQMQAYINEYLDDRGEYYYGY